MRVLVACECSGTVREAFRARGHDAISCDIQDTDIPGPHIKGDVIEVLDYGWDMMIAHPPCTRLANSGVRWLHNPPKGRTLEEMWEELEEGCKFYSAIRNANIPKKCIENPIMHKYAKERIPNLGPRQIVQPWWFGEEAFKATGFELINLPKLKPTNKLVPPAKGTEEHVIWTRRIHNLPNNKMRAKLRSKTFQGIADAMAAQWG